MPLFPLVRNIPGATPQLRCDHFHSEFWWPTGAIIMARDSAARIYIYMMITMKNKQTNMKMRPEIWKTCVYVGCSKS